MKCAYNETKFSEMHACSLLCTSNVNYGITHANINLLKHVERHHKNEQKIIMHDQATKDNAKQLALIQ